MPNPDDRLFSSGGAKRVCQSFDPDLVQPPLTESEILEAFRPGGVLVFRSADEVEAKGLQIVPITGADPLPPRLRDAHVEIRPGADMTRTEFKQALKELE